MKDNKHISNWAPALHKLRKYLYPVGTVFHHVPKCAGGSFHRQLRKIYPFSSNRLSQIPDTKYEFIKKPHGLILDNEYNYLKRLIVLEYFLSSGSAYVSGHVPFSSRIFEIYKNTHKFVTILRDPVDRFVSNYLFNYRQLSNEELLKEFPNYLKTEEAIGHGRMITVYFSDIYEYGLTSDDSIIKRSLNNLQKFHHVSKVSENDSQEHFLDEIKKYPIGKMPRRNSGRHKSVHLQVTEKYDKQIQNICSLDLTIYREYFNS